MRLAALTFQHISRELTSEQQPPERLSDLDRLQECARTIVVMVACSAVAGLETSDSSSLERQEQDLVQSASSYLPCLALTITYHVYMSLLLQLSALPSGNSSTTTCGTTTTTSAGGSSTSVRSSSSSSSSSVATSGVQSWQDPVQAWQFACSQHQLLPASHHHLLQMLGCSSRAVLWFAAATAGSPLSAFAQLPSAQAVKSVHRYVAILSTLYCTVAGLEPESLQQQGQQGQQLQHQQQEEQQELLQQEQAASGAAGPASHNGCVNSTARGTAQQLRAMLPAVLFYLPAHLPFDEEDIWLRDCNRDCNWAVESFRGWSGLQPALRLLVTESSRPTPDLQKLSAVREVADLNQDLMLLTLETSSKLLQVLNAPGSNSADSGSNGSGGLPSRAVLTERLSEPERRDMATSWLSLLMKVGAYVGN